MSALRLDDTGDLAVTAGRCSLITGGAETAQRLQTKFRFFLGEWFLDERAGFPLYEEILVKGPDLSVVRARVRQVLVEDEGVVSVEHIDLDFNTAARELSVSFEATGIDGEPITFADFILGGNR